MKYRVTAGKLVLAAIDRRSRQATRGPAADNALSDAFLSLGYIGYAPPPSTGEAARDVRGRLPPFVGVPYGSDARLLIDHGATPTVLYGPGDPEFAHAVDERVALEDVTSCARVSTLAAWTPRSICR